MLVIICNYFNAVKYFTLFEAVINIKKGILFIYINHVMDYNLSGRTNNYTEFPRIFLDSLRHDVNLHKFKNKP